MVSIIFWGLITLIGIVLLISALIYDDVLSFGEYMGLLIMVCFSFVMTGVSIDKRQTKTLFKRLRVGNVYVGTPKDNPFITDTIKIVNFVEKNNKYWVMYETPDGKSHVSNFENIIDYIK